MSVIVLLVYSAQAWATVGVVQTLLVVGPVTLTAAALEATRMAASTVVGWTGCDGWAIDDTHGTGIQVWEDDADGHHR